VRGIDHSALPHLVLVYYTKNFVLLFVVGNFISLICLPLPPDRRERVLARDGARSRPAEFQKRLKNFIKKMEQNKQFGYGIEKDY
jgi:hypothetical protein